MGHNRLGTSHALDSNGQSVMEGERHVISLGAGQAWLNYADATQA